MTVSVIIPMYNAGDSIVKTLESCIAQTYLPKEIIVVDDCSSDNSFQRAEAWKKNYTGKVEIILKRLTVNGGPSKARNLGWDSAQGEFISFLDADDLFLTEKFAVVVPILRENKDIVLLAHDYSTEDKKTEINLNLHKIGVADLLLKNLFATPAVTIKRAIPERFDETMRYTEDHDLWLRVTQKYDQTFMIAPVLTVIGRPVRSVGGLSGNLWAMRRGEIKMYRKFCRETKLMALFPLFVIFSLSKHLVKIVKGRS